MEGQYVRTVFDFATTQYGEVALRIGDVALLLYPVDDNWVCGKFRGQVGNFPVSFVEAIPVPQIVPGEKLFCGLQDFPAQMSGDLPFKRGDIVVGMKSVDKSWWHGRSGEQFGMFPVTHVRELDTAPPDEFVPPSGQGSRSDQKSGDIFSGVKTVDSQSDLEGDVVARGHANMDLKAQYGDELSFNKGDVVSIIKVMDSDFAVGECNGSKGSFPMSFVDIFEGEVTSPVTVEPKRSKFKWWEEDAAATVSKQTGTSTYGNSSLSHSGVSAAAPEVHRSVNNAQNISSYVESNVSNANLTASNSAGLATVLSQSVEYPNTVDSEISKSPLSAYTSRHELQEVPQSSENSFTVHNLQGIDSNPVSQVTSSSDLKTHRRTGSYTLENTRSYDSSVTPYGKTLFPFVAENHTELSFFDNEIVTLIQHIDDQWIEGEIEGRTGIFPASFIEVIVDCPWPEDYKVGGEETASEMTRTEGQHVGQGDPEEIVYDANTTISTLNEVEESFTKTVETVADFLSSTVDTLYGRVMHSYCPDNPNDPSFPEGDTISIIRQVDEYWFEVQTDSGLFGYCPVNYVEVFENMPDVTTSNEQSVDIVIREHGEQNKTLIQSHNGIIKSGKSFEGDAENRAIKSSPVVTAKPEVLSKPKPAIKPKPQLKPKPNTLKLLNNNNALAIPPQGGDELLCKPELSLQRAKSCDTAPRQSPTEVPSLSRQSSEGSLSPPVKARPQRPSLPPTQRSPTKSDKSPAGLQPSKPSAGPVFARTDSFTMSGSSLDTIIEDQMKVAKVEAQSRSRSASMLSDASSTSSTGSSAQPPIPPRKCDVQRQATSSSQRNYGALRELQNTGLANKKVPKQERKVAFSTFYTDNDPSSEPADQVSAQIQEPLDTLPPSGMARNSRQVEPPNSLQGGSRPVPQRKAPPRPSHPGGRGTSPGDLIAFSPNGNTLQLGSSGDLEQAQNAEVVSDLDKRIREIEDDIQAYTKNKNELERFLVKHHGDTMDEKAKVQENLDFTRANIQGLTEELNTLRENLYGLRPERQAIDQERESQAEQQRLLVEEQRRREEVEKRHQEETIKRRHETRTRVIQELVQTEKDYLRSITVCHDTFFDPSFPRHHLVEIDQLFGNIEEVVDLSQRLLSALEQSTQGKEFDQQKIGECFVMLKKDMTKVYAPYCKNHDDVLQLLEKYEENPGIQMYINAGMELIKEQMAVFDLGSVLIKPVQRILKYPLLLNELIKNTEEDHPDKFHLLGAITCMTQVAATINEFKRRKDLVKKYKVEKKEDLGDKLARLNVHSTKKKLSRLSQKMVGPLTVDENFKIEERKFKNLESALRTLVRNVSQYLDHIQESTSSLEMVANDLSDYYAEKGYIPQIERYCQVTNHIATKLCYRFRQQLEMQVIHPLNRLLVLFMAPNKVIKKRHDKLLDYDNLRSKTQSGAEVELAKKTYEALNAQLLDELPQLYGLCLQLIQDCLLRLVSTQKHFHEDALNEMYKLLGIDLVLSTDEHGFLEHFLSAHTQMVEKLSDLSFIPKSFNPKVEERKPQQLKARRSSDYKTSGSSSPKGSRQSEAVKNQLRSQYPTERVYQVVQDQPGAGQMDLSVQQGWLVGVLKEGDPMGNKDRWFVDNGVDKGFVPKSCLTLSSPHRPSSGSFTTDLLSDDLFTDAQCKSPAMASKNDDVFDPFDPSPSHQSASSTHSNPAVNYQSDAVLQPQPAGSQSHPSISIENQNGSQPDPVMSQSDPVLYQTGGKTGSVAAVDIDTDFLDDQLEDVEYYQAIYSFTARTDLEITLTEGHYVKVVEKHDLDGNEEWWLVEADGHQGYAPSNYIQKV